MARIARVVLPNSPHHVTQRGNRQQTVFFSDKDYRTYLEFIAHHARKANTQILAYCLMPNHVHFVMTPTHADGLRATLGEAHRRYTQHVNQREDWAGHLWQGRFYSFPMDEAHLLQAVRYIELNPVAAGMVKRPQDWQWSSAAAHLSGAPDPLVDAHSAREWVDDWSAYLKEGMEKSESQRIEAHLRNGRPLGNAKFIEHAERALDRPLRKRKAGRKALPNQDIAADK